MKTIGHLCSQESHLSVSENEYHAAEVQHSFTN